MKIAHLLCTLALISSGAVCQGAGYWFNTGDSQGWTYRLVNYTTDVEIRSGTAGWSDINDYPNVYTDPVGDNCGAAQAALWADDYRSASDGDYLVLEFHSPDLTKVSSWQSASSFSACLLPSYTPDLWSPDIYANLFVTVNDLDAKTTRIFYTGAATSIPETVWTRLEFDLASAFAGAKPPVTHYELAEITIKFWIAVSSDRSVAEPLIFDIDNVMTPFSFILGAHAVMIPDNWGAYLQAMRLMWRSRPGRSYTVQRSGDLRRWHDLATVQSQDNETTFIDHDVSGPNKFYRVRDNGDIDPGNK